MYEPYAKAYRHYSAIYGANTAIFYMVGKFYEMYDILDASGDCSTSMKRAADLLGIQVATRKGDAPGGQTGLFAGVPEQSLHKYAAVLTRSGWTVVVIDQVKDSTGGVVDRVASRILTPGTHVEALSSAEAVVMAGIWLEEGAWGSRAPPSFGLVAMDLTTGTITTYESSAVGKDTSWIADDAIHFIQVFAPREVVVWWRGAAVAMPDEATLRRQFAIQGTLHLVHADAKAQGGLELALVREDLLRRSIPVRGAGALHPVREALCLTRTPLVERGLAALLQRVEELFPSAPKQLRVPEAWSPATNLFLGNQALSQLNMICSRQEDSVLGLFTRTRTPMGQRAMRKRLLHPVADIGTLNRLYDQVEAPARLDANTQAAVERALGLLGDLPRLHRKIAMGSLTAVDVLALDQSYSCLEALAVAVKGSPLAAPAAVNQEPAAAFRTAFDVEKAKVANEDAFCLTDVVAPVVATAEARIRELYAEMNRIVRSLAEWVGTIPPDSLRLEFRETMGPTVSGPKAVMAATVARLGGAPYPDIRVNAKKGGTTLEIPALDALFRQLLEARAALVCAVKEAMPAVCEQLTVWLEQWDAMEEWAATVDVSWTLWRTCEDLRFVRPLLVPGEEAKLNLEGLRHPLIEAAAMRTEYVRHSVALGSKEGQGWLVYGMNASGKSSLMKAVGLSVLLAQAGCFVPASRMTLTPFRGLYTRILNTDNLWAGLSSFAVEMTELREILQRADKWSLVLGDELCSGTESVSATAIVGAGLAHLHGRGAKFIFATHLHGLMDIPRVRALERLQVWHLKVRYDMATDRLIYERTLTPGPGSSLYGLEVARAMALPDSVLEMAHELRRGILGTATAAEAPVSVWNGQVVRQACEVCGAALVKDLEVHHIQPRASGVNNHVRNLAVLCAKCHDKHHAGEIVVQPLVATSDGPVRPAVAPVAAPSGPKSGKWTTEQKEIIRAYLRNYPTLAPKRLVFDLGQKEGIVISEASLRAMRGKL